MRKLGLGLEFAEPLNLIPFSKEKAMQEFRMNLNGNTMVANIMRSIYKFYQSYILPVKFNIDKRKVHLSAQIRNGEITRASALDELMKPVYSAVDLERDFEFVAKKLDFKIDELKAILQDKPVSHSNFATDQTFMSLL